MGFGEFISLLTVIALVVTVTANSDPYRVRYDEDSQCGVADYLYRPPEDFPITSADLLIFSSPAIACTGYLHTWRFLAMSREIRGLHLCVFRHIADIDGDLFQFVNHTIVDISLDQMQNITGYNAHRTWISITVPYPFKVQTGDYLGVYYENSHYGNLAIATRPVEFLGADSPHGNYNTFHYVDLDGSNFDRRQLLEGNDADMIVEEIPALIPLVRRSDDDPKKQEQLMMARLMKKLPKQPVMNDAPTIGRILSAASSLVTLPHSTLILNFLLVKCLLL